MTVPVRPEDAISETAEIDFKASFDPAAAQDWCELVKDIVAMSNSGGGAILVGIEDDGRPSGADVQPVLDLDPAVVMDKLHKYTGQQLAIFRITKAQRQSQLVAIIAIEATRIPIIFTAPGTYSIGGGNQKTAFSRGTVYFRHGPKSEPGTSEDLRNALERELERVRHSWLDGISKVVTAPPGSSINVLPPEVELANSESATPIRLTTDENAPAFRAVQADKLYPYRQKELANRINQLLGAAIVSTHDVFCVRRIHGIDGNPTFSYKSQWSPRQYSEACAEWMVAQYRANPNFFQAARAAYKRHA